MINIDFCRAHLTHVCTKYFTLYGAVFFRQRSVWHVRMYLIFLCYFKLVSIAYQTKNLYGTFTACSYFNSYHFGVDVQSNFVSLQSFYVKGIVRAKIGQIRVFFLQKMCLYVLVDHDLKYYRGSAIVNPEKMGPKGANTRNFIKISDDLLLLL